MNTHSEVPTDEREKIWDRHDEIVNILIHGDVPDFDALQKQEQSFPHGRDKLFDRHWITNAIHYKAEKAIRWLIEQGVDLSYRDGEGLTVLSEILDSDPPEFRYAMLRLLLAAGAKHDVISSNFFTAAHWAARFNDVEALQILKEYGADLCVATLDIDWRTPEDVARANQCAEALAYLENVCHGCANRLYE